MIVVGLVVPSSERPMELTDPERLKRSSYSWEMLSGDLKAVEREEEERYCGMGRYEDWSIIVIV